MEIWEHNPYRSIWCVWCIPFIYFVRFFYTAYIFFQDLPCPLSKYVTSFYSVRKSPYQPMNAKMVRLKPKSKMDLHIYSPPQRFHFENPHMKLYSPSFLLFWTSFFDLHPSPTTSDVDLQWCSWWEDVYKSPLYSSFS